MFVELKTFWNLAISTENPSLGVHYPGICRTETTSHVLVSDKSARLLPRVVRALRMIFAFYLKLWRDVYLPSLTEPAELSDRNGMYIPPLAARTNGDGAKRI